MWLQDLLGTVFLLFSNQVLEDLFEAETFQLYDISCFDHGLGKQLISDYLSEITGDIHDRSLSWVVSWSPLPPVVSGRLSI